MKKRFFSGTTLLEAVIVTSFMGLLFLLLYKAVDLSMRTYQSVFNGDISVRQNAYALEEIISRKIRESNADTISAYPLNPSFPNNNTGAFIIPGSDYGWIAPAIQYMPGINLSPETEEESLSPSPSPSPSAEEQDFVGGLAKFDVLFVYLYDRYGDFATRLRGSSAKPSFRDRYSLYEIRVKINPIVLTKRLSGTVDYATLKEFLISSALGSDKRSIRIRKLASNVVYFRVEMSKYPLLYIRSSFMYGKGGNSSRQVIEDRNIKNLTEIFELDFYAMPYYN